MTPPSAAEQLASLASLTGTVTERKPETALDANLLRLRLVAQAKDAGIPWTVIGRTLGVSGKEAKRRTKALARQTQRQLLMAKR